MRNKKPGNRKIRNYTARQRKKWCVGEFTQYGTDITFEFEPLGEQCDFDKMVDDILDIVDKYKVDTVMGWDTNTIHMITEFTIPIFEYKGRALGKAFVELIVNEINQVAFRGKIKNIRLNYDAVWEDE